MNLFLILEAQIKLLISSGSFPVKLQMKTFIKSFLLELLLIFTWLIIFYDRVPIIKAEFQL